MTIPKQNQSRTISLWRRCILRLLVGILQLLAKTYRITYTQPQTFASMLAKEQQFIFALWHEYLFTAIACHSQVTTYTLISSSKDGDYAAYLAQCFGFSAIRGSGHRGGVRAYGQLLQALSDGHSVAITVDGPRGPRRQCKRGFIGLASQSSVPILPVIFEIDRYWKFRSWDEFKIPKPFAKIKVDYASVTKLSGPLNEDEFANVIQNISHQLNIIEFHSGQKISY